RFEPEVEPALARIHPRLARPSGRRLGPRAAAGVAVAAAVAVVAVLLTRATGIEVVPRALAALGPAGTVLHVVEQVEPRPGTFARSVRVGWLDLARGRARWDTYARGGRVATTLLEG